MTLKFQKPVKSEPVKVKGVTMTESSSDPLGLDSDDGSLFSKPPVKKTEPQEEKVPSAGFEDDDDMFSTPKQSQTVKVPGVTEGESTSDPLGLGGNDEDMFTKPPPKQEEPEVVKPKKPAGAVSMFGGLDPSALLKKKSPSSETEKGKIVTKRND